MHSNELQCMQQSILVLYSRYLFAITALVIYSYCDTINLFDDFILSTLQTIVDYRESQYIIENYK